MRHLGPTLCKVPPRDRASGKGSRGDAPCAGAGAALAPAQGCRGSPTFPIQQREFPSGCLHPQWKQQIQPPPRDRASGKGSRGDAPCEVQGPRPCAGLGGSPGVTQSMIKKGKEKTEFPSGCLHPQWKQQILPPAGTRPHPTSLTLGHPPRRRRLGWPWRFHRIQTEKTARRPFFSMRKRAINNSPRGSRSSSGDARRRGKPQGPWCPRRCDRSCGTPTP